MIAGPPPFDVQENELPAPLSQVVELLARKAHGQWRARRKAEGWRCGPRSDEQRREDASLFDFELLPPIEREYGRAMVREALKAALAIGYKIVPPSEIANAVDGTIPAELTSDCRLLETVGSGMTVEASRRLGEELLRLGESVMAYDFTLAALEDYRGDIRLRQLHAVALSRCGATDEAETLLRALRDEGHADAEIPRLPPPSPNALSAPGGSPSAAKDAALATTCAGTDSPVISRIATLLFIDVKGFGKLSEAQIPRFFQLFLQVVGEVLRASACQPRLRNTWGDGLCMLFDSARDAGRLALELRDHARGVDWQKQGLPVNLAFRIGLHTGPVWQCDDPLMGAATFLGGQLGRADRLEPITPPGHVYASQSFAVRASDEGTSELVFEYVGRIPLARNHGMLPIYHVGRQAG